MAESIRHRRFPIGKTIIYIILSLWAVTTIYPFVWILMNSFKHRSLIIVEAFSLPLGEKFTMDNYVVAFRRIDILGAYRNSLVISIVVTIVVVLLAGLAAYGMARYRFRGRKFLQSLLIASMMFPVFSTIIPVFRMLHSWGLVGTGTASVWPALVGVMLPQIAGNLSFATIVLMGFIRGLPVDLEEAAYMEGCNVLQCYFRVVVPIAKPSFATVAIFTFLWSYNDLFTQSFFLNYKNQWTITILLNQLTSLEGTNYGLMAAAVSLVVVPVVLVYIFLQKSIIKGMTAGAIKG